MAAASDMGFLVDASIYLAASIISVTLFTRLRLGALLGYLAAGVLIGPHMLGLISDAQSVLHTAEFGVVLLLFIIGLELKPAKLWALRQAIFGLGVAQLLLTGLVLAALVGVVLDLRWEAAIIVGFALALSSTAFAMQLMKENGTLNSPRGETAFGILLLQDLAIVPLLALVALLGGSQKMAPSSTLWLEGAGVVGAVAAVVIAGRYLLNPLFRLIAATGAREVLAGAALLVVVGTAAIFTNLGLSMALGAFLAGVALADSEFRHQLEADIEPFRGLLMGLFFVAVGMSLDFTVIKAAWLLVLGLTVGVVLVKAGLLYILVRSFKGTQPDARAIAATLLQGGEFGFVLFGAAVVAGLLTGEISSVLSAVVTLSMALTPFSARLARRLELRDAQQRERGDGAEEDIAQALGAKGLPAKGIVVGYGRFGQVVTQLLRARGLEVMLIDQASEQIRLTRQFGNIVYYGDGRRLDVLRAAGAHDAQILVYCSDGAGVNADTIAAIRHEFPHLKIFVRAHDRRHHLALWAAEADGIVRETFESSIALGQHILASLNTPATTIDAITAEFRRRDQERMALQSATGDLRAGLDLVFRADAPFAPAAFDIGPTDWGTEPPSMPAQETRPADNEGVLVEAQYKAAMFEDIYGPETCVQWSTLKR